MYSLLRTLLQSPLERCSVRLFSLSEAEAVVEQMAAAVAVPGQRF